MKPQTDIGRSTTPISRECRVCGAWTEREIPHTCPGTVETSANDRTVAILSRLDRIICILDEMRLRR